MEYLKVQFKNSSYCFCYIKIISEVILYLRTLYITLCTHTHTFYLFFPLLLLLLQMVFVSLGAPRRERKGEGVQLPASCLPPPQKDNIPMLLLLQEPHLTTLFDLLEMLASFKPPSGKVAVEDSEVTLSFYFHKVLFCVSVEWKIILVNVLRVVKLRKPIIYSLAI